MQDWTPLHQENMNAWLQASNESAEANSRERDYVCCEIGVTHPVNTFYVRRGATDEELAEQLAMLRNVCGNFESNNFGGENDETRAYKAILKEFATIPESEIYLVFHDDCTSIPRTKINGVCEGREWSREFTDEWNVLANWHSADGIFQEVWDRRKVPYAQGCERIKQMKPLLLKVKEPFKVEQKYFDKIKNIVDKLVDVDLENGPYKIVVEQLWLRDELEQHYAILAAQKFRFLAGGNTYFTATANSERNSTANYALVFQLSQYDDWDSWHEFFKKHCQIEEWTDRRYEKFPSAYWDVSGDPDFAHAQQKVYPIKLSYYDAHGSGW